MSRKKKTDRFAVAKCFDTSICDIAPNEAIRKDYGFKGIPKFLKEYRTDSCICIVREYIEGTPLSELVKDQKLTQKQIVDICLKLSDILIFLHNQDSPVIHRDIKPENIILTDEGDVYLIDLDIARIVKAEAESDTLFFGTKGYAPPEQYGFSQTDAKADIYSFGVLLRFLMTGSVKPNSNIRIYRPLQRIIDKCSAFAPEKRYSDMKTVKRVLQAANPKTQLLRASGIALAALILCAALTFGGIRLYQHLTYTPFTADHIPAYLSDEGRIADAVAYMKDCYATEMFDETDDLATIGDLRAAMIELYGLEYNYVYGINTDMPQESEAFFLPWGWDDNQNVDRDIMVYAAVKVHDTSIVEDWSKIKDDNGYYPGVRAAMAFAGEAGILQGANKPGDISLGEMAIILANTDRVFEGAATE